MCFFNITFIIIIEIVSREFVNNGNNHFTFVINNRIEKVKVTNEIYKMELNSSERKTLAEEVKKLPGYDNLNFD